MKTIMKLAVGGVALAGAVGAHASNTFALPSTDNGSLFFYVTDTSTHSTYTVGLSENINGAGGYFSSTDATSPGVAATPGSSQGTIYGDGNFSDTFGSGSTLASFISSANTAGQNLQWGIISGAYTGATSSAKAPVGNALVITTATSGVPLSYNESNVTSGVWGDFNTDSKTLNNQTYDSANGTTSGVFGTSLSAGGTNETLYGTLGSGTGLGIGSTAYTLYGLATNGTISGQAAEYNIGTVSFDGTTLSFTGNVLPTPLPAAAWLFGSGLLGLLGIGRRKASA